jgi:hypothetical protein
MTGRRQWTTSCAVHACWLIIDQPSALSGGAFPGRRTLPEKSPGLFRMSLDKGDPQDSTWRNAPARERAMSGPVQEAQRAQEQQVPQHERDASIMDVHSAPR